LLDISFSYISQGSERILVITDAPAVKCSDAGTFRIQFWQEGNKAAIHTATVDITISRK